MEMPKLLSWVLVASLLVLLLPAQSYAATRCIMTGELLQASLQLETVRTSNSSNLCTWSIVTHKNSSAGLEIQEKNKNKSVVRLFGNSKDADGIFIENNQILSRNTSTQFGSSKVQDQIFGIAKDTRFTGIATGKDNSLNITLAGIEFTAILLASNTLDFTFNGLHVTYWLDKGVIKINVEGNQTHWVSLYSKNRTIVESFYSHGKNATCLNVTKLFASKVEGSSSVFDKCKLTTKLDDVTTLQLQINAAQTEATVTHVSRATNTISTLQGKWTITCIERVQTAFHSAVYLSNYCPPWKYQNTEGKFNWDFISRTASPGYIVYQHSQKIQTWKEPNLHLGHYELNLFEKLFLIRSFKNKNAIGLLFNGLLAEENSENEKYKVDITHDWYKRTSQKSTPPQYEILHRQIIHVLKAESQKSSELKKPNVTPVDTPLVVSRIQDNDASISDTVRPTAYSFEQVEPIKAPEKKKGEMIKSLEGSNVTTKNGETMNAKISNASQAVDQTSGRKNEHEAPVDVPHVAEQVKDRGCSYYQDSCTSRNNLEQAKIVVSFTVVVVITSAGLVVGVLVTVIILRWQISKRVA